MKLKELSLTDVIACISAASVLVSVASQSYFYYRLDAIWMMSLLTPSIYFIDVVRVIILFILLFFNVLIVELLFKLLIKYFVRKKKIRYFSNRDLQKLLIKNRKIYEINITVFLGVFLTLEIILLSFIGFNFDLVVFIWIAIISGFILALFTNKESDKITRYLTLLFILLSVTALNGEMKILELKQAPYVYVKDELSEKYRVVEVMQDQIIAINDKSKNLDIKLIKTEKIEKIVVEKSSNQ